MRVPQIVIEKSNNFTVLANAALQDPELSLKARGLLGYMLSLPADWDYTIAGLSAKCREGVSAIRGAIAELMQAGYVQRRQTRDEHGRLSGYEYTVYESPSCDYPTTEKPTSENRTQQNKNLTKQELNKTPCSPPAGDGGEDAEPETEARPSRQVSAPKYHPEWFETLWKLYPNGRNRKAACKAWDKLKPDRELCRFMFQSIRLQLRGEDWARDGGRYVPHFSSWLNGQRWTDEVRLVTPREDPGGGWAEDPEVTG